MSRGTPAGARSAHPAAPAFDPDACIVHIAAHGCRDSFARLFTVYAPKLKSYFLRFGALEEAAEELAQETMLTIWRKAAVFDPGRARAPAWIFTIARNLRVDRLRHERHPDDFRADPLPEPQATPEHQINSAQSERLLHQALDELPPEQAEVLRLAYLEDQSHAAIAERLGLPIGTVKSRIRLGSAHLRSSLGEIS